MVNNMHEAPCIYFSSSDDGYLLQANKHLCAALGYLPEELEGQKLDFIFTLPTRIFQQTHFFPLLKMQGHGEEIFITLRQKNGDPLPVLINAERKVVEEEPVHVYIGIIVHNRKKFEDELIAAKKTAEKALNENTALVQARQELQQRAEALERQMQLSQKQNAELKQFSRVVTHDLQEPLRKMSIFASMLAADPFEQDQKKIVEKMDKAMLQMRNTISGLQKYVWLNETPPQPEVLHSDQLVLPIIDKLKEEYPDVELSIEHAAPFEIVGDSEQLALLFYELLSNVIRYRQKEKEAFVSISASTVQLNMFRHVEGKYLYSDFLRIQIEDEGIGFDAFYQNQVFELFKRLHQQSGRGIGLSLCKKVAENHHGSIQIQSNVNEGTTVFVFLPVHHQQEKEASHQEIAIKTY
jgi:sigma-B regulation protein RsbU (phosphoserine phosphatase)